MTTPKESDSWVGALGGGGLVSLVAGLLYLRRRLSGDNKEIARDKADTSLISRLEKRAEASDARAATADARVLELVTELERAKGEVVRLRDDVSGLLHELKKRTRSLPADVRRIVDTNFADFDDRPTPPALGDEQQGKK